MTLTNGEPLHVSERVWNLGSRAPYDEHGDHGFERVECAICRVCREDCDDLALDKLNDRLEAQDWEDRDPDDVVCSKCEVKR